ncbi:MAG: phosphodiester glycosidase family protein [Chloroflexi bacterium]|nr:phosphodiester glycosidase family protein [Chloroflexota bacterium]MCI0575488.1 phosphodiester glycosidase family protein [Chloroflexota bacterium]MCI0646670.1 phosphodiester glycosidase family protein [Chloroflexota bacterium]MCI0726399.1 phosphodiester glycosidase family protein [Chloroflexota bacterium]
MRIRSRKYLWFFLLALAALALGRAVAHQGAALAAGLADPLRGLIGAEGVATLETLFFNAQDQVKQWEYGLGFKEPEAPWAVAAAPIGPTSTPAASPSPTPPPATLTPTSALPPQMVADSLQATATQPAATATQAPPTPTLTATPWRPASIAPLGSLEGEGLWSPYLFSPAGQIVAFRTFLQPDPERPFTTVGVVAFDLTQSRLHFVLGASEPSVPGGPRGAGRMTASDRVPGLLLAAFNGGFKAVHGTYGAMAGGAEALPPLDGLGTVAIYQDGAVQIGRWGEDILPLPAIVAWRQNAPLVVENGQVTAVAERNSIVDWSGSIDGEVITWRSGLGLSADGRVLYYFAGPSLGMPALGRAMVAAGVDQGMLLDINSYWVHFTAIRPAGDELLAEPLFGREMDTHPDRFLRASDRDFFYVTAVVEEQVVDGLVNGPPE